MSGGKKKGKKGNQFPGYAYPVEQPPPPPPPPQPQSHHQQNQDLYFAQHQQQQPYQQQQYQDPGYGAPQQYQNFGGYGATPLVFFPGAPMPQPHGIYDSTRFPSAAMPSGDSFHQQGGPPQRQTTNYNGYSGAPPAPSPMQGQWQGGVGQERATGQKAGGMAPNVQVINGVPRIVGGRKKALLIGINYTGTKSALRGCHRDVQNMRELLVQSYGFPDDAQSMIVLMDDRKDKDAWFLPIRKSIESAMQWLVADAKAGDSLFFHFSGHGGQMADKNGDEDDGMDETILPLDHETAGQIVDDRMHALMVRALPPGVRLTTLFDSCHSGTALDLPFVYLPDGSVKQQKSGLASLGGGIKEAGSAYLRGDIMGAVQGLFGGISNAAAAGDKKQRSRIVADKTCRGTAISFSGCKDRQTSADTVIDNSATGALSWALTTSLRKKPTQSYAELLRSTRELLVQKFSQVPQMSAGALMDMRSVFAL